MNEKLESEEERLERLSDEEFARSGVFNMSIKIDVNISEDYMLQDLTHKTEGKNIKAEKPNLN